MKKHKNKKIYVGDKPGGPDVTPPPLKDQIVGFAKSFAGWIKEGAPVVEPKEYMERLTTCHTCKDYDSSKDRCNHCGCTMRMKAKMKTSECPIKKWESDKAKDEKR